MDAVSSAALTPAAPHVAEQPDVGKAGSPTDIAFVFGSVSVLLEWWRFFLRAPLLSRSSQTFLSSL